MKHSYVNIIYTNRYKIIIKLHVNGLKAMHRDIIRHFSVTPYITICPSTETYFGLNLRGAMSAVTGIYLFRLLLNIIFFVLRSFCTLTNSAYEG